MSTIIAARGLHLISASLAALALVLLTGCGDSVPSELEEELPTTWVSSLLALTYAGSINDHGEIVGRQDCCAARWTESEGVVRFGGEGSAARGVNNHGWFVGQVQGDANKAFIFEAGVFTHLDADGSASATAINDAGTILGGASGKAMVWRRDAEGRYGSPLVLPLVNDGQDLQNVYAAAINEAGDITGALVPQASGEPVVAVLWRVRPEGTYDLPIILGGSGPRWGNDINDAGWIVGVNDAEPALWHPDDYSTPIALPSGSGGGWAMAVNNDNQVAGHRSGMEFRSPGVNAGGTYRATLWQLDSEGNTVETTTLEPAPDYTDSDAIALNAHGWVVGRSSVVRDNQGWVEEVTLWRPDL